MEVINIELTSKSVFKGEVVMFVGANFKKSKWPLQVKCGEGAAIILRSHEAGEFAPATLI